MADHDCSICGGDCDCGAVDELECDGCIDCFIEEDDGVDFDDDVEDNDDDDDEEEWT